MNSASFRKNRFFGPGRRLAAPEGHKIVGGGLAGAKGKARVVPGHPKEEGFSDSLASPESLQGER